MTEDQKEKKCKYNRERYYKLKEQGFTEEFKQKGREAALRHYYRNPKTEEQRKAHAEYMRQYWNENRDKLNAKRNEKRRQNREKYRDQQNAWAMSNPHRKMFTNAKARAKKQGLEFSITLDDILPLPIHCPILGVLLRKGESINDSNSYSLDRIDNSKGYVHGNVAVISRRANVLKRDGTIKEFESLISWLKNKRKNHG